MYFLSENEMDFDLCKQANVPFLLIFCSMYILYVVVRGLGTCSAPGAERIDVHFNPVFFFVW